MVACSRSSHLYRRWDTSRRSGRSHPTTAFALLRARPQAPAVVPEMQWVSFLPWLVRMRTLLPLTLLLLSSVGCVGELMMPEPMVVEPDAGPALSTAALSEPEAFGVSLLQRLTQRQLVGGAEVLFGVSAGQSADLAPLDSPSATYFDNDADGLGFSLQLITDYEALVEKVLAALSPATLATCVALLSIPEAIRGYGHVKEANVEKAKAETQRLLAELATPRQAAAE